MSMPKKLDSKTANQLRSIFSKLDISKKKVTIDLEENTIEIIEDDYSIDDILESAGALTSERAKEMQEEVKRMREEWN
jgi:anti-anti-sigma regulatory factor